jgi:hypothetical protein
LNPWVIRLDSAKGIPAAGGVRGQAGAVSKGTSDSLAAVDESGG